MSVTSLFRPDSIPTGLQGYWKLDKGHTVAAQNNTQVDTAQFKFGSAAMLNASGADRLLIPHSEDWNFRISAFTLECWVRFSDTSGDQTFIDRNSTSDFQFGKRATGNIEFQIAGGATVNAAWGPSTGVWYHVAAVRYGTTTKVFIDGTQVGSSGTNSSDINSTVDIAIGNYSTSTSTPFKGHIDEVRISNVARYTANFTPSASAFTTDISTLLLLHMEGSDASTSFPDSSSSATTYADSSANANHLTDNNTVGGTIYDYWNNERCADFESGNSEYLSIADGSQTGLDMSASGTDVFTFACWVKFETVGTTQYLMGKGGTGYQILKVSTDALRLYMNGTEITTATGVVVAGRWYHVAFVYDRPNSFGSIYLDGNLIKVDATASIANNASAFQLGADGAAGSTLDGMMKDAAFWTAALTPLQIKSLALGIDCSLDTYRPDDVSTAPTAYWKLNEISSGAGAVSRADSAGSHTLTDVNTVQSAAGYIEGAGADLELSNSEKFTAVDSADWAIGTGDASWATWFSMETNQARSMSFFTQEVDVNNNIEIFASPASIGINVWSGGVQIVAIAVTTNMSLNAWYHFALVKDGDLYKFFIDGKLMGVGTDTSSLPDFASVLTIGQAPSPASSTYSDGKLADYAFWKGYALTDAEVALLAGGLPVHQQGLVTYWPFTEDRSAKTCTAVGNAQVDTAQFKTGSASLLLDGAGDGVDVGLSAEQDFNFGSGDFTIEGYMRLSSFVTDATLFSAFDSPGYIFIIQGGASAMRLYSDGSTSVVVTTTGISLNTWYHFAVVRLGSKIYFYQDGVLQGTPQTAAAVYLPSGVAQVGAYNKPNSNVPTGWIDSVRVSKGIARYTGNFTPYTTLPTTDKYTALLMDFEGADASTSFTDLAASGATPTSFDDPIGGHDGFNYNSAIMAVGGPGSGNALRLNSASSQAMGANDTVYLDKMNTKWMTVGGWFMSRTASGQQHLFCKGPTSSALGWNLRFDGTSNIIWELGNGSTFQNPSRLGPPDPGILYHVVGTWDGAKLKLYVDGYTDLSGGTLSGAFPGNANNALVGADSGPSNFLNGTADEVFYFNRPLREEEVKAIYIMGVVGVSVTDEPATPPDPSLQYRKRGMFATFPV